VLGGELDRATASDLVRVLGTMSSYGDITLDVSRLRFLDEAGLAILAATAARLQGSLVLVAGHDAAGGSLGLSRMASNVVLQVPDAVATAATTGSAAL
jgi:anti-anti-sigma regulatory factor